MKITIINETNYYAFQDILPQYKSQRPAYLFGGVVDDIAVGTIALDSFEDGYSIAWLWVAPEYRRKGIGGALLDEVCKLSVGMSKACLTVTYPADALWADVMEYMLWMRGFQVFVQTYPMYLFTKEQLLSAPLLEKTELVPDSRVVPLSKVIRSQLQEMIEENRQIENYYVSHAEYDRADGERSRALIQGGRIMGLILVSTFGEEDQLSLDLLYLRNSDLRVALTLMQQVALAALEHPAGLREFRFICTEEVVEKICRRLMGEKKALNVNYCHGILQTDLYLERRTEHVRS